MSVARRVQVIDEDAQRAVAARIEALLAENARLRLLCRRAERAMVLYGNSTGWPWPDVMPAGYEEIIDELRQAAGEEADG